MTKQGILEALRQVEVHCELLMADYTMVSLRGALYTLGYETSQANEVIRYCAEHGFDYCVDPLIPGRDGRRVDQSVCQWGPDQLASRICHIR